MIIKGSGELQQLSESREDSGNRAPADQSSWHKSHLRAFNLKLVEQNLQFSTGGGQLARE